MPRIHARTRLRSRTNAVQRDPTPQRGMLLTGVLLLVLASITVRLFYWQVIQGTTLEAAAESQYQHTVNRSGQRGSILTADGYTLVTNQKVYRLFAQPHLMSEHSLLVASSISARLAPELPEFQSASGSAERALLEQELTKDITAKLSKPNAKWVSLYPNLSESAKTAVEALQLPYLGFDTEYRRFYPEASMAAHLVGFVGKDDAGQDIGYFGLEGALENELKARKSSGTIVTDALGVRLAGDELPSPELLNGRDIVTTIRRDVQFLIEQELRTALEQYGAASGEVIVLDPRTGKILGLTALPAFDPSSFHAFDTSLYKNPSLTSLYEPGSTLKTLTVAAGIDAGVISPNTHCPQCAGPRVFGKYTIKTWNDEYHPDITMEEALAKSDNTAMIYIAELLGAERFREYLKSFGIGSEIEIDLQGDLPTPFPEKWGPVELATTSFGQGISTTSLQLVRAVAAIANDGVLVRPTVIEYVTDPTTGEAILNHPVEEGRVISASAAHTVTSMMVAAAQKGEAQWIAAKRRAVAGKTGTSQVAVDGAYAEDKTIASFIGFSPPDDPKFIMLVKLNEPTSSPWAAETAAPLWYKIAERLYLLLDVPPEQ